ncbi:sensor histidine kinase [Isachenkonia alkalipeptolytica]|uniref:histidine kinase n=1 Tax=Isachenkonia alkalipeptolytica TaxID=2565777 RepID=A0AA44BDY5_9CLOT|nr:sensor histidine kinase [Isachenkonia alkalipeptolytica]NBG86921.1 sensor histidine kinase [Isachenkonia alkalipeptolytica]
MKELGKGFKIGYLLIFLGFVVTTETVGNPVPLLIIAFVLIQLIYEKYFPHRGFLVLQLVPLLYGIFMAPYMVLLFPLWVYDMVQEKQLWGILLPVALGIYLEDLEGFWILLFLVSLTGFASYGISTLLEKEQGLQQSFDEERRLRYQLEKQKMDLIQSNRKVQALTEATERNRIAGEIHDNVGHEIAGVLMQLEVGEKLMERDPDASKKAILQARSKLADTLVLLRNTVHNLRPREKSGLQYLKEVIEGFEYGNIHFEHSGDFNPLSNLHYEVLGSNLKEALTNIQKYSRAENIIIKIEAMDKLVRLYVKDDGIGCNAPSFNQGMGLKGMKERAENLGGNLSVDGKEGFLVVTILPIDKKS